MSALVDNPSPAARMVPAGWLSAMLDVPAARIWLQAAVLVLVSALPVLAAAAVETRTLNGINLWIKPLKFQLSVALHLATLAWASTLLRPAAARSRWLGALALVSAGAAMAEIVYIVAQAARGRHSHFNADTPFESAMYAAMGIGAVILVAAAGILGAMVWRRPGPGLGDGLRLGAMLGLIGGAAATLVVAGYLGSHGGHWVGGATSDAGGLPVVGWSTVGGDLRVAHFFATHMMQGLPLVGLLADRAGWPGRRAVPLAAAIWLAVVAATFMQALAGIPLLGTAVG
ncbi:MAG: hypothetical protein R3F55_24835 [Alphaproteobacteria bacterium]